MTVKKPFYNYLILRILNGKVIKKIKKFFLNIAIGISLMALNNSTDSNIIKLPLKTLKLLCKKKRFMFHNKISFVFIQYMIFLISISKDCQKTKHNPLLY